MPGDDFSTNPRQAGDGGGHRVVDAGQAGERVWILSRLWWTVVGAAIGFGIVGLLTIGWPFLLLGVVLAVIGAVVPWVHTRAIHVGFAGVAAAPLTLAWFNRNGPGTVCRVNRSVTTCVDQWSPWPFLAVAAALVTAGVLLERHRRPGR